MWETMHCCNIWFGNRQNSIPNSIRKETKVWQHLSSTWSISYWNSTVSLLPSIYCIIWWTSQTKRMSCPCQTIYQIISTSQKLQTLQVHAWNIRFVYGKNTLWVIPRDIWKCRKHSFTDYTELWIITNKYLDEHEWLQEIEELLAAHRLYTLEVIDRKRGKVVKYWTNYVNMIHLYCGFCRTIRTWDLYLFISSLPKVKWTVKHHDDFLNFQRSILRYI